VTFPPAAGTDALARLLGQELGSRVGQTVVVENRPGASGNIAAEFVAKFARRRIHAAHRQQLLAMNPGLFDKLPFDPIGDFAPVIMVASVPSMIAVHPSLAAKGICASSSRSAKRGPGS